MKFEQLFTFFHYLNKLTCIHIYIVNFFLIKINNRFPTWLSFNQADYFWFIFSNKKTSHELRFFFK